MLTHHGAYTTPHTFINGFIPAVWVAVGLSAIGILAAVLTGARRQRQHSTETVELTLAAQPQGA